MKIFRTFLVAALLPGWVLAWNHPDEGQLQWRRYQAPDQGSANGAWAFCVAANGDMFIGANRVILSRNAWHSQALSGPAGREFRALAAGDDGRIWIGGIGEIGFFQLNEFGDYRFTSLATEFLRATAGKSVGALLAVLPLGAEQAAFVGRDAVHYWNGKTFAHWPLPGELALQPLHPRPDALWVYQADVGLWNLAANGPQLIAKDSAFPGSLEWVLAPADAAETPPDTALAPLRPGWIVGTPNGVFKRTATNWEPLPRLTKQLKNTRPTAAMALTAEMFAVSTTRAGIFFATRDDVIHSHVEGEPIVGENQINTLWKDANGDLWLASAVGWTRIVSPDQFTSVLSEDESQAMLAVRGLAWHRGSIYAAASTGIYQVAPGDARTAWARLRALPAPPGMPWTLVSSGRDLFGGGVGGLWRWNETTWELKAESENNVTITLLSSSRPERLYYNDGNKLRFLDLTRNVSSAAFLLEDQPLSLIEDAEGTLWVSTVQGDVYQFKQTDRGFESVQQLNLGGGLPANTSRVTLTQLSGHVVAFTSKEILALNAQKNAFEPAAGLESFRALAAATTSSDGQAFWLLSQNRSGNYQPNLVFAAEVTIGADRRWRYTMLKGDGFTNQAEYNAMLVAPDRSALWLAGLRNLARFGPAALQPAPPPPAPRLARISARIGARRNPETNAPVPFPAANIDFPLSGATEPLPANTESIRFEFTSTSRSDNRDLQFRTQLVGLEQDWSTTFTTLREFTGLAAGNYEFRLQTLDNSGQVGPVLSYAFSKQAAWYVRWPAWVSYVAVLGLLVAGAMRWRLRNLKKQNERLNQMVEIRTRELAMANSAKMEFLASISHEIRNPLNGITGLVALLSDAPLAAREKELARSLSACARSLRRVFDEVLGFARLEEGRVSVRPIVFSLPALLQEIAGVFTAEATQRHSTIRLEIEPANPPALLGDEEKIRTIVANFVANALKYAPGSPVFIEAQLEPSGDRTVALTLQVRDQGPGVPPEEQELIFRKFVRGRSAEDQREPGAGLGLATCQALARLMGGGIGVESTVGAGSTFYLQITLEVATELQGKLGDAAAPTSVPTAPANDLPAVKHALVIEDQEYNQLVARSILGRLGYHVALAANAETARAHLVKGGYGLVLMDWDVPGAKGDDLTRFLRALPGSQDVVVIAVTAHDDDEIRQACLEAGMDGFLVKPLDEALLLHTLRNLASQTQTVAPTRNAIATPSGEGADFQVFSYLGRGSGPQVEAAAREYLQQLAAELAELDRATQEGNLAGVASCAHRLRAHAAIVQFTPLREAAKTLQLQAHSQDAAGLKKLTDVVHRRAATLRSLVEHYLAPTDPKAAH